MPTKTSASEVGLVEDFSEDVMPADSMSCEPPPKEDAKHQQQFETSNEQKENTKPNVVAVRNQVHA